MIILCAVVWVEVVAAHLHVGSVGAVVVHILFQAHAAADTLLDVLYGNCSYSLFLHRILLVLNHLLFLQLLIHRIRHNLLHPFQAFITIRIAHPISMLRKLPTRGLHLIIP